MAGSTISFINMIKGLNEKGISVYIVVPKKDEFFTNLVINYVKDIYVVPIVMSIWPMIENNKEVSIRSLLFYLHYALSLIVIKYRSYIKLRRIVREISPDIIHTNTGVVHEGYYCAKNFKIPHVWHLREYQDKDFNMKIFPSRHIFQKQLQDSYVISITKDILDNFALKHTYKHKVIYNGIFPNQSFDIHFPKKKNFLCASRLSPEKGHDDTIRAFAEFYRRNEDYKLVILGFGNDSYICKLKQLAHQLGCAQAIEWPGYKEDVKPYMKEAKALVVSSFCEGFGRMTAEAAFMGCMVIGRETGGTKEIMDLIGGASFDNVDRLVEKMDYVVNMPDDEYKRCVIRSQEIALKTYSNEANIDNVYAFYMNILKRVSNNQDV